MDKPRLSDKASTPIIPSSGDVIREKTIYHEGGGEDSKAWSVDVIPLRGASGLGRSLDGGRLKPRATFEVRAEFMGPPLPEFIQRGSPDLVKRVETFNTEELELATAIAKRTTELLHIGERDILLNVVAEQLRR